MLDAHIELQGKKEEESANNFDSFQLLEKVLEIFKELYHGIFFLHNKRKTSTSPSTNTVTASDLDSRNISILMDMGFTHAQAVNALSIFSSVDEAADHLLFSGNAAQDAIMQPAEVCFKKK